MSNKEIDIIALFRRLWTKKRFIFIFILSTLFVGIIVAFSSPKIFKSTCVFVTQSYSKSASNSLSSFAAFAGINLGDMGSSQNLSPKVYPIIFKNINFQKDMMNTNITISGIDHPVTLFDYFTDKKYSKFNIIDFVRKYTIGLPGQIIGLFKKDGKGVDTSINKINDPSLTYVSSQEKAFISKLNSALKMELNDKEGYITIEVEMPEAIAAAQVAKASFDLLQKYVTSFKIQKAQDNLKYVDERYLEAKDNFENKQIEYAKFKDSNRIISSAVASIQEEKLKSEYELSNAIFEELARQKLQVSLKVKEDTPILTPVEPPIVPNSSSKPRKSLIIISFLLLGIVLSSGTVLVLDALKNENIKSLSDW